MTVPYVNVGDKVTAAQLNALSQAADAKLANLFYGYPALLWGGGFARRFYFYNSIPSGPPFANIAQAYIYWCSQNLSSALWFRNYDHTPFSNFAAAATLETVAAADPRPVANSAYPVARVNSATLSPALNWLNPPFGEPLQLLLGSLEAHRKNLTVLLVTTQNFTVPTVGAGVVFWVNDGLLLSPGTTVIIDGGNYTITARAGNQVTATYLGGAAHTPTCPSASPVMNGGVQISETNNYYIYVADDHAAEHVEIFQPIDVIFGDGVGSSFVWPSNWNKYRFIRFNNLQDIDMTVSFGPASLSGVPSAVGVPKRSSTPIRNVNATTWDLNSLGLTHFFTAYAGDPLFLHLPPHDGQPDHDDNTNRGYGNPLTDRLAAARLLLRNAPTSLVFDWSQFNDTTAIYCGPGKLFGDLSNNATPLGDTVCHTGKIIIVDLDSEGDAIPQTQNFTLGALPDTELLLMGSGANAIGVTSVTVTRGGVSIPATGNWSTTAISGGVDITFNSGGVLNPGDLVTVHFSCNRREPNFQIINFTGLMNLASDFAGTLVTVTVPSPAGSEGFRLSSAKNVHVLGIGTNVLGAAAITSQPLNFIPITAGSYADVFPPAGAASPSWTLTAPHFTHATNVETDSWTDYATGNPMSVTVNVLQMTEDGGSAIATTGAMDTIGTIKTGLSGVGGDASLSLALRMTDAGVAGILSLSMGVPACAHPHLAQYFDLDGSTGTLSGSASVSFPECDFWNRRRNQNQPYPSNAADFFNLQGYGGWPDLQSTYAVLEVNYPRDPLKWQIGRVFNRSAIYEPFNWNTTDWLTVDEHPLVRSWYEVQPFADAGSVQSVLIPESKATTNQATLCKVLARYLYWAPVGSLLHITNDWVPASAFFNYEKWSWTDPVTGVVTNYDFTSGGKDRAGFYDTLFGASPATWGRYALTIEPEHYNLAAGVINSATGDFGAPQVPSTIAGIIPPFTVGGGISGFRPRTQFCHWNHSDTHATEIESFWTSFGVTIRTSADFVAKNQAGTVIPFSNVMTANLNFVSNETTLTTSENPGGMASVLLCTSSPFYLFGGLGTSTTNDYRWVTIADAQAVYASLGIPFVFEELVVPVKLVMADAVLSHAPAGIVGGPLPYGYPVCRMANWICDPLGDWVWDATDGTATLDSWTQLPVIRQFDGQIDYAIQNITVTDFSGLEALIWAGGFIRQTQGLPGHRAYIYRRYGSPPCKFFLFGKNYADYQPRNGKFAGSGLTYVPRVAVSTLDGTRTIIDVSGADETVITTTMENAILMKWTSPRAI